MERILGALLAEGKRESQAIARRISREFFRLLEASPVVTRREFRHLEERVKALEALLSRSAPDEVEPGGGASSVLPGEAPGS